jgi:hypothetical protein
MMSSEGFYAINGKKELKVVGLLAPQCSIVVKDRDAISLWNKGVVCCVRNLVYKIDYRLLRITIVPRLKNPFMTDIWIFFIVIIFLASKDE